MSDSDANKSVDDDSDNKTDGLTLRERALSTDGFGPALAQVALGSLRVLVDDLYPQHRYGWPSLRGFRVEFHITPNNVLVVILRDQIGVDLAHNGQVIETDSLPAVRDETGPECHKRLREHFAARDCDAIFLIPLRVVSEDPNVIEDSWPGEDLGFIAAQAVMNVNCQAGHLHLPDTVAASRTRDTASYEDVTGWVNAAQVADLLAMAGETVRD